MKKLLKKLSVMRLEERVLFDAAAAAAAAEAEQQAQQSEELQQQQQQLQEQLAEEAEQQAQQQAEQQAVAEAQQAAGAESGAETEAGGDGEAAAPQDAAAANGGESANAGSEVSAAVEAIAADEGIEVEESTDVLENDTEEMVGENAADVIAVDVEAEAEESSADLEAAAEAEADDKEEIVMTTEEVAAAIADGTRHELVIVSSSVKDSKVIIDSLAEGTEVLVLDNESDVLDQINEYLDKSAVKYDAIHVVSHGGDGYILLNNSVIDMTALKADPASWAAIGEHVAEEGDILLYGCNVAQTENGKAFANQLASLTGADIAASVDATGGTYGWELEYVTNAVHTPVYSFNDYSHKLLTLTLVESGSFGSGENGRNWSTQNEIGALGAGTYYAIADTTHIRYNGTTAVTIEAGQLFTMTGVAGEGGAVTRTYAAVENSGNAAYVLGIAEGTELVSDTIVITSTNLVGPADLGNIAPAVRHGGLTINLGEDVTATFNAADDLVGSLSVTGTNNSVLTQIGGNLRVTNGESITISGGFASVTLYDVEVVGSGTQFAIEGAVADIRISDNGDDNEAIWVDALGGSFTIDAQATGFEVGASNVIVNGDVRIVGSTFTVDLTGNNATLEESKFIVHGDFYARSGGMTGSEVSISVTDVFNPNLSLDGDVVGMHYGTDGGGWVNFDSIQDNSPYGDTAVIFDGSLYVNAEGHEGGELHYANMSIDGGDGVVNYIYVKNDFIVGGAKTTGSFSASDFYSFYFDAGTDKVFSIGKDDSASFTAENRAYYNPSEWGRGYFGTRNRVTVDRQVNIAAGATLTINNLMMDIKDSVPDNNVDFSHLGVINGENSELVFREDVVISGTDYAGGTVHLHSVRYENGVEAAVERDGGTGMLDTKFNFYHGEYGSLGIWLDGRTDYKIDMDLFQEITIHNITFINQNNDEGLHVNLVDGEEGVLTGSSGSVTMEGEFAFTEAQLPNTTFDFEVGSTVNVIYNRAFEQYVLSGNYYELTVTNTADKILAGNIVVGVSIDKIKELNKLYGASDSKDAQIAARKFSHAYRGGISLGAGLRTMGYDVDFYGYTYASTEKAKIYSENASGNVAGRVSYHVAQTLVNMDQDMELTVDNPFGGGQITVTENPWDNAMGLNLGGITHTDHGVGPGVPGHERIDEAYRAFFGGTYNNLTIDTMATLPPKAGAQFIPSEEIIFTMDDSATIYGDMTVTALWDGTTSTQHHYFSVNVTSDVTFVGNNNNIVLDDANLHFSGSVTGNFESITAVRDEYYSANGVTVQTSLGAYERVLSLVFDQKMSNIGLLHTDGVSITFESDVASINNITVGTPGLHTGKVNTRDEVLTFNGSVELVDSVVTTRQFDDVKPIFNFNGETTGNATFDSFRSVVNFNHRGDLTIFQGAYDELYIAGEGDEFVDGVKTVIGNTTVGGTFNANLANITIENGTLSLQTFYEDFYGDLHRPHISVGAGAGLEFRAANTEGIRFYGTIESAGTITILGRGNFYGDITLTGEGNMSIDGSAEGSEFARVINRGSGFDIIRDININELHNYGEITIRNNNIGLDVYNHAGGNLIFDINSGTVGANGYEFNFRPGEGEENIEWSDAVSYVAHDEVRHGNLYIANGDVPEGVEPGVEYWREIEAFDSSIGKTYKLGDIVFNTEGGVTKVYRSVDTYVPANSDLSDGAYWEEVGTVDPYSDGLTYAAGQLVLKDTSVYVAMTEVAAGTLPGTQYWTPVSHGATNRLINGGTVTVNNGTLNLNNFTQGDKNAETGRWTYGGEGFVVGKLGTLVLGAAIDQINTGNNLPTGDVLDDSYLGSVSNSGTIKVADSAGDIKFVGEITNESGSKFILNNDQTTFNGNFVHHGSLTSENASGTNIIFGTQSVVSGSGTIGGTQGYDGNVSYNGANQQILTGIYNDTVTLSTGVKTVAGDIVFNGDVLSSATVSGEGSSIRFNGNTTYTGYAGTFEGSLNVIYGDTASTVYSGSYGDLVINSTTAREIGVDLAAVNLTLNGENTFNGADADNIADVTVSGLITLSDNSSTTFGQFSSLNAGTDTAVMIKGGNYGTLTFSTAAIGENVTVNPEGLLATVTYNYVGEETQRILDGTYMNNVTLSGDSVKEISGSVNVNGELLSNDDADDSKLSVANGGVLEIVGTIQADSIEIAQGGTLTLILTGHSTLGTDTDYVVTDSQGNITSASSTGVILGGTLNLRGNTSTTLSVYGWQDTGSAGEINVNSGVIRFEGAPGVYGYIKAIVNDYTDNGVIDPGNRLQNLWITITSDTLTSELERYGANSKFRIINGATLTVDYFDFPNAAIPSIGTTVQSFRLEGNSYLVFAMVDPYAGTEITVNELIVQAGSNVVVNAGMTVEIGSSSALDGTISGAGNVTVENSTLSGTGVFNMTDGTVTYGANQSIYGGTYNNLQLGDSSTIAASATVNGVVSFAGTLNIDGAAVAFKGIDMDMGDEIALENGASLNFTGTTDASDFAGAAKITGENDTTVTYGENAGVYAGTYGSLTITGDHELAGSININTGASLTGVMSGSADVTFAAGAVLSGNGSFGSETTSYAGIVSYDGNSIFSGFYASLLINNGGTVASGTNIAAEYIELSGTLTVEGNISFTDTTTANSDGEINATAGTVTYASGANVYGGEYNNLVIYGSHNLVNSFTVNGTTTIFDNADESDASLTGDADLIFKGAVTGNGAYFGYGTDAYEGAVTYESAGDILGGIYTDLTINASNKVIGSSFEVRGALTLADGITLRGNGDWAIGTTNASESSTARIENEGTVTYSGLGAGDSGWIYGGNYDNLAVDGGDYSVREVTIGSTLSGTGKIIFTADVYGEGSAVDANADYLYGTTALAGTYDNLGIGAEVTIPVENSSTDPSVIVNGELTALNDSASITGSGTLEIAGSLAAFNSLGRFEHSGNVIFSGNEDYNVDGGTNRSSFNVLTVGEKAKLSVANTLFASLTGAGDVTVNTNVSGGVVDMSGGTVTYDADASEVLIQGTYNNLTLAQSGTLVRNSAEISVKGLFDMDKHDIINTGNLTIYTFDNEANLDNSGTLTFGSNDESVSSPADYQVWEGGLIENEGEVIINRSNYAIAAIVHDDQESSNWGTVSITESAQSKADRSDVVMVGIYSVSGENVADQGTVINLNANAYLFDVGNFEQFTNRGTLNIGGNAGTNAASMHIINVHQGEITVNDIEYTFGFGEDSVQLTNGGSVTVNGEKGVVIFKEVNENIAGNPVYTTRGGGTFVFDFAEDSSNFNFKNGLLGDLKNNEGNMIFITDGMKYLGNVTNGNGTSTMGEMYIMADSTFRGSVSSTYGIIQIGDSLSNEPVNAIFLRAVSTGSYFQVLNKAYAEFNAQVTVEHEFYMESGSNALFKSNLSILSNTANQADTLFHVKEGAKVVVNGDVLNQNGYDALQLDGGTYSSTSTPPTWRSEYYSATGWVTELRIEGNITIDGTLTNRAYGLERLHSFNDNNQARVVVESDGNVFGAIRNYGDAARFDMNGSNNQFNGVVENTGDLFLNGRNDYNSIINDGYSISFKVDSASISESSSGYIWINDNASGSTFRGVENKSGTTFTVGSYDSNGIDLRFEGPVSNSGTFNLNADGYVFNGVFTNNSSLRVDAVGFFNSEVVNKGNFNVAVEGVMFNKVTNSGTFSINAEKTVFTGMFTNSGTLNVNASNLFFPEVSNSGTINLHGAEQTVFENLSQKGGTIDIDKDSTLHLHVVADDEASSIIVRGERSGIFENHKVVNKSDSGHGLYFESVTTLKEPQVINANITYEGEIIEDSVWYDSKYSNLAGEEALWIVVDQAWIKENGNTLTDISLNERYRLVEGVTLTVMGTASGSRFQVKDGSTLVFANEQSLTINGMLEVMSADAVLVLSGLTTFNGVITNKGTVNISEKSHNTFKEFNNLGTVNAYANVSGVINNNGNYVIKGSNIVVNDSLNNVNGTLTVLKSAKLSHDIGGKIAIQEGGVLKVGVTAISSTLTNNGTVAINNDLNHLAVNGNVLKGDGAFTSSKPATLVFAGDVATGTSAEFSSNILNVEYSGTSSGQNIILGTYSDLSITGAVKVIDDGVVTVGGNFVNGSGVSITDDGKLILKGAVTGSGIYSNSGSLSFSGAADVGGAVDNSGTLTVAGNNNTFASVNNTGTFNVTGAAVVANLQNSSKVNVTGSATLAGTNTGSVIVDGKLTAQGFSSTGSVSVNTAGQVTMNDNGLLNGSVINAGSVTANGDNAAFGSKFTNSGSLTVNGDNATFAGNTNTGSVTVKGSGADLSGAVNSGTIALHGENAIAGDLVNTGDLQIHHNTAVVTDNIRNTDGKISYHVDAVLNSEITSGIVSVENSNATLTLAVDEVKGNYDVAKGALSLNAPGGSVVIASNMNIGSKGTLLLNNETLVNGDMTNSGVINTQNNDLTFEGKTLGNGSVAGNTSNTVTYGLKAVNIYDGVYANLVIQGEKTIAEGSLVAVTDNFVNDGAVTTDGTLQMNGGTYGDGTMAGGSGQVIYNGSGDEQTIYAGAYNDIALGQDATGNFDIADDITVAGDAFNKSTNGAELAVSSGKVTYNGTGEQHVMAGTYDELIMAGSGTKLMEADTFNVNSFVSDGGTHSGMITLTSASKPALWTLNAASSSIHYSYVDYANSTTSIFLDGTNMTGGNNSNKWAVFNSAGGVGDAWPSLTNPNFQAIATYMTDLSLEWSSTARFDLFRRMPGDRLPLAVGDAGDAIELNSVDSYDMINFDGEFFGEEGISILDEESRDVLEDAVSAEASDLKALLED